MSSKRTAAATDGDHDNDDDNAKPPTKRMRPTSSSQTGRNAIDFSSLEQGSVNLSKIDELMEAMLDQLRHIKNDSKAVAASSAVAPSSSLTATATTTSLRRGLLILRAWQRNLLQHCSSLEKSCQEHRQAKRRQEQIWDSLQYEKSHLQRQIATVQNFSMPHLDQVLHEQRQEQPKHKQQQQPSDITQQQTNGDDAVSSSSSSSLEPNNPNHRTAILQYLQSEIQQRSSLEKERDRLKARLKVIQRKCKVELNTLQQLPQHLETLEHATKPLQNWFALPYIGTARSERLQLAQQLSPPLYTLFVSLQEYMDLMDAPSLSSSSPSSISTTFVEDDKNNDRNNSNNKDSSPLHDSDSDDKMSLRIVPIITRSSSNNEQAMQPHEIQWSLPVPDVAAMTITSKSRPVNTTTNKNQKKRSVTIHFQHEEDEKKSSSSSFRRKGPRFMKAVVSGCPTALDQTWLLSSLFPNEDEDEHVINESGYHRWCHYLAGIHLVSGAAPPTAASPGAAPPTAASPGAAPPTAAAAAGTSYVPLRTTTTSTRAIVHTIQRRIRANATLKYILQSLCQHHRIPNIPYNDTDCNTTNATPSNDGAMAAPRPSVPSSWQLSFTQQHQQSVMRGSYSDMDDNNDDDKTLLSTSIFTYAVHCKKSLSRNNTMELRAAVVIDKARYPSVPPHWKLFPEQPSFETTAASSSLSSSSSPASYNVTWNLLEQDVNHDLLLSPTTANDLLLVGKAQETTARHEHSNDTTPTTTSEDAVMKDAIPTPQEEEEGESEQSLLFAEWILVHQLNRLLVKWEELVTSTTSTSSLSGGIRAVRGRDRVPLSLFDPNNKEMT